MTELIFTAPIPNMDTLWEKVLHEGLKIMRHKGYILLEEERETRKLYYLRKGEVSLMSIHEDGSERLLGKTKAPALLCEEGMFLERSPLRTAIMFTTPCTVYAFSALWIQEKLLPCYPDLTWTLIQSLSAKTVKLVHQRVFLSSDTVFSLVCKFFHEHSITEDDKTYVKTGLSQRALANFLGVHYVSLNKVLKTMYNENIIGVYNKEKTIIYQPKRIV